MGYLAYMLVQKHALKSLLLLEQSAHHFFRFETALLKAGRAYHPYQWRTIGCGCKG